MAICRAVTSTRERTNAEVVDGEGEVARRLAMMVADGDLRARRSGMRSLRTTSARAVDRLAVEAGERGDPDERPLELADVRGDLRGDELQHLVRAIRRSCMVFLRRIAMRVSRSGGWMSVIRPHSNRLRMRSSKS
jgi:hypothetical protein